MTKEGVEAFAAKLHEIGYPAQIDDEIIRSVSDGMKFAVYLNKDNWIQFHLTIGNAEDAVKFETEDANNFNRMYRFYKVFIENDGSISLTVDFFYEEASDLAISSELLSDWLVTWSLGISLFRKFIIERA